jgi:hypothetical protein
MNCPYCKLKVQENIRLRLDTQIKFTCSSCGKPLVAAVQLLKLPEKQNAMDTAAPVAPASSVTAPIESTAPVEYADKTAERAHLIAAIERLLAQGKGNGRNGRTWSNSKPRSLSARSLTQLRSLHQQLSAH